MGAVSGAAAIPMGSQRERTAVALSPLHPKTTPNATPMGPQGQKVAAWCRLVSEGFGPALQCCCEGFECVGSGGGNALGWQHPFLPGWLEAPWWHWSPLQVSQLELSGSQIWKPFPKRMGKVACVWAHARRCRDRSFRICGFRIVCFFWQVAPPRSPLGRWHCWGGTRCQRLGPGVPVTPRGHRELESATGSVWGRLVPSCSSPAAFAGSTVVSCSWPLAWGHISGVRVVAVALPPGCPRVAGGGGQPSRAAWMGNNAPLLTASSIVPANPF